jgi:hypothetical protein
VKRLISVLLATSICLSIYLIYPLNHMTLHAADAAAQTETDLESMIREQIEAFAKSIDQTDAANKAAKSLANHGISGRGKKLSVGKNHALTATLWNSNWLQEALTNSCVKMIETGKTIAQSKVYGRGSCYWREDKTFYNCAIYDYDFDLNVYKAIIDIHKTDYCALIKKTWFTEPQNTYDSSLFMIVGHVFFSVDLELKQANKDTVVYDVVVKIIDRFDFHTSSGSGFQDFISGIGALLFREFDWESKVSFQLTVPNECEHSFDSEADRDCSGCGYIRALRGDMNGDGAKNSADAIYLLRHILMPGVYPASQSADMNGDGVINSADSIYLLRHTLMPDLYPLG